MENAKDSNNNSYSNNNSFKRATDMQFSLEKDGTVLQEIVEYVVNNIDNHDAMISALDIQDNNGKNVMMLLLERRCLDAVKTLLSVGNIICSSNKLLSHVDSKGQNILVYFFMFGDLQLTKEFMELLKDNSDKDDVRQLFFTKRFDQKTPLMILCAQDDIASMNTETNNAEHNDVDILKFRATIDCTAFTLGLDVLQELFLSVDDTNSNVLLLLIKNRGYDICNVIFDVIEKTFLEQATCSEIKCNMIAQCNKDSNNAMSLLCGEDDSEAKAVLMRCIGALQDGVHGSSCITTITTANADGNNVIMLSLIHNNTTLTESVFTIIQSMQPHVKRIVIQKIVSQYNKDNNNIITLLLQKNYKFYTPFINEITGNLSHQEVIDLFRQTLKHYPNLLHISLSTMDPKIVVNVMQYVQEANKDNTLSTDDKVSISELLMQKDITERNALMYAVASGNSKIFDLMLDLAKTLNNILVYKILLSTRDIEGHTAYMISKLNKHNDIAQSIEHFAEATGNNDYIQYQQRELAKIQKLHSNVIYKLAARKI